YVEGQNLHIAFRWAEGRYERLPQLESELANLNVSVITAIGAQAALAAVAATKMIPTAFISSVDPVKMGLVKSFNRPDGNATGVAFLESELVSKQFELLRDAETQLESVTVAKQALGFGNCCCQREYRARSGTSLRGVRPEGRCCIRDRLRSVFL